MNSRALSTGAILVTLLVLCTGCLIEIGPAVRTHESKSPIPGTDPMPGPVTLVSWNIGYAGMGKESDFLLDHGRSLRPRSKQLVIKNLRGILETLSMIDAQLFLLQEAAGPSWNTFGVDVFRVLRREFGAYHWYFDPDIAIGLNDDHSGIINGNATASILQTRSVESYPLSRETGLIGKEYAVLVTTLERAEHVWAILNIHLSAFDAQMEGLRERQVKEVMELARSLYERGAYVVIGGDWNLRLMETRFPHTTALEDLFWIRDLDTHLIPQGWQVATDPAVPTVRTAQRPYEKGLNHTLIIDGFVLSPNVRLEEIKTLDLGFEYSDHQPVILTVRAHDPVAEKQ
jgi:endonuclease/exonuclease/phosphatase family metal-dependent hydrolase